MPPSVLNISRLQDERLGEAVQETFAARTCDFLGRHMPELRSIFDPAALRAAVVDQIATARRVGFSTEIEVVRFVVVSLATDAAEELSIVRDLLLDVSQSPSSRLSAAEDLLDRLEPATRR